MGHLDKLTITNRVIAAPRPRRKTDSLEYRRNKLIANLEEQIELAQRALQDEPLQLQRKRGHGIVKVRPRLWWNTEPDGKVFAEVRYNKVALRLRGKGNSIEVGPLKRLPTVYRTVIKAIKAGELDHAIRTASRKSHL